MHVMCIIARSLLSSLQHGSDSLLLIVMTVLLLIGYLMGWVLEQQDAFFSSKLSATYETVDKTCCLTWRWLIYLTAAAAHDVVEEHVVVLLLLKGQCSAVELGATCGTWCSKPVLGTLWSSST